MFNLFYTYFIIAYTNHIGGVMAVLLWITHLGMDTCWLLGS